MSALAPCLQALAEHLGAMRATLATEGEALQRGDADALPDCVGRKEAQAKALVAAWGDLTNQLGLTEASSRAAVEQAIARADPGLGATWAGIVGLVDEIGRLNRLNGQLIQEQLRRTQTALEILQTAAGQAALYGSDGRSIELFGPNRSIDEA